MIRHGLIAFLAVCLTGCLSQEDQAGGEDFPNTVSVLGRALAEGMDSSQGWNGLDSAQLTPALGEVRLDTPSARSGLSARRVALGCLDTSYGAALDAHRYFFSSTVCLRPGEGLRRDSLVFGGYFLGMKDADIDTVFWSQTDSVRPLVGYSALKTTQDASGRGYFLLRSDTGRILISGLEQWGSLERITRLVVGAGRDRSFKSDRDNTIWSGIRGTLRAQDTLEWMDVHSWKEGLPVVGEADSGWAAVRHVVRNSSLSREEGGVLVTFRDSTRNYALRWSERREWGPSLFREQVATGPREGGTFWPRDTLRFLERAHRGADSLWQEVRALASPDPRDRRRDSLLSIRSLRHHSALRERQVLWEFFADTPVANGQEPSQGRIHVRVDLADGGYLDFQGAWDQTWFTGNWSDGKNSGTVRFDRQGRER